MGKYVAAKETQIVEVILVPSSIVPRKVVQLALSHTTKTYGAVQALSTIQVSHTKNH